MGKETEAEMEEEIEAKGRESLNKSRVRKGVIIAVALSAASLIIISLFTLHSDTFAALSHVSLGFLILAAAINLGKWIWPAISIDILISSTDKKVPFRNILKTVYSNYFTGLVTPWRAGGVTAEAFLLYEYGLDAGESIAIIGFREFISTVVLILFLPLAIWGSETYLNLSVAFRGLLIFAAVFGVIFMGLMLLALLRPTQAVGNTLLNHSPSFLRHRDGYRRALERVSSEIETFSQSLRSIIKLGAPKMVVIFFLNVLYWTAGFIAIPVAVIGLGYGSYFWHAVIAQLVIQVLLPFAPTPGASALGEVGFLFVYKSVLPDVGVAALLTLIWRFIDFYLGLLVGGTAFIIAMNDIGKGVRRKTLEAREPGDSSGGPGGERAAVRLESGGGDSSSDKSEEKPADLLV